MTGKQESVRLGTRKAFEEINYDVIASRAVIPGKRAENANRINNPCFLLVVGYLCSCFKKEIIAMRPSWDSIWMKFATSIAERSYDPRNKVGTVIVTQDNTQVLAVGYNGNYFWRTQQGRI